MIEGELKVLSLSFGDPGPFPALSSPPPDRRAVERSMSELPPAHSDFWNVPGLSRAPSDAVSPLVGRLVGALDALAAHGALSGSRADTAALLDQAERARGLALRELAEMDAVGGHLRTGRASTTASWLRDEQRMSDGAARSAVALSVALRDELPALGALLVEGAITLEHAAAVRDGVRGLDAEVVRDAAQALCALAQVADPTDVRKRLRDKAAAVDDRIAAQAERRARERMGLRLNDVGSHTAVDGTLAGDDGATVRLAMALAVEAGRAEGETRGKAARQAEVLVGWAQTYLARQHGPGDSLADDAHTVRTHLHVVCRPEQLLGASASGVGPTGATTCHDAVTASFTDLLRDDLAGAPPAAPGVAGDCGALSRGALRRLACDATVSLCVLPGSASGSSRLGREGAGPGRLGDPLYVGRSSRTVTGAQFRALVVRDRQCVVQGCHRPPAQCAAHHVRHWVDGGDTDLPNLVLLCAQHHHDHHDRGHDLPHQDGLRRLTVHGWRQARPWDRGQPLEPPPF